MKESKAKWCPKCQGQGFIIDHIQGELSPDGKSIDTSKVAYGLCPRCLGICIIGIPELEHLSPQQRQGLVKGKTSEQIFNLLNNKSHEELLNIIQNIPSQDDGE